MKQFFVKMDSYSRHAYLYSAWTAMFIPCILASVMIYYSEPTSELQGLWKAITSSLPIVVFLALGYFLRERIRVTSKILFQFPLFKEDETYMPTTDLLMWSSKYPEEMKKAIRKKVKSDFNYTMPSKEDEKNDSEAARRNIAAIVGSIRNKARNAGDVVYTQANYRYGYTRNLMGGLVWSFMITALLMILNCVVKILSTQCFIVALVLIVLWLLLEYFVFYKHSARNYARQLFETYLAIK